VFKNGVLRRVFEPKREEIRGYLRRTHNIDHHQVHQGEQIKAYETGEACRTHERGDHSTQIIYRKPERKTA
jgi:hypothetical protein